VAPDELVLSAARVGIERTTARPALAVKSLTKSFSGTVALADLHLEIAPGEVHALVGENGSGKSTFIKILAGYHRPDSGSVEIAGERLPFGAPEAAHASGCRFVHQDLGLILNLSILDNLFLNSGFTCSFGTIRSAATKARATNLLRRVGLDLDPRLLVGELSPAQRTGVAVARALEGQDEHLVRLLVLDEPTATLPEVEVEQLLSMVKRVAADGVAVLYVSHRLEDVFDVADNVTVLRDGRKVATAPVPTLDRRGLISLLVGKEVELNQTLSHANRPERVVERILRVRDLVAPSLIGVSFQAGAGDIIGFAGITGSGRETVLGTVFGAIPRLGGSVELSGKQVPPSDPAASIASGMAYLPPDRRVNGSAMSLSARENLTITGLRPYWKMPVIQKGLERKDARYWFERLGVRPVDATESPLENFSGGNQQKILFGKWLRRQPKVFLLDEPTQGVDVGAKAELHSQLSAAAGAGAAIIVSSSDVEELVGLCHRVCVLRGGRIVADLEGENVTAVRISQASLGVEQEVRQVP